MIGLNFLTPKNCEWSYHQQSMRWELWRIHWSLTHLCYVKVALYYFINEEVFASFDNDGGSMFEYLKYDFETLYKKGMLPA